MDELKRLEEAFNKLNERYNEDIRILSRRIFELEAILEGYRKHAQGLSDKRD